MPALNPADGPAMAYWPRGSEATRLAPGYVRVSGRSKRSSNFDRSLLKE
jgi:hypothetical protein